MTRFSWIAAGVAAATWFFLIPAAMSVLIPADRWIEVRSVYIHNARVGEPVLMAVDRTIHRDFFGEYHVEVRRQHGGGFAHHCDGGDEVPYRRNAVLPQPLDLNWWMGIPPNPPCDLTPGTYYTINTWRVPILGGMVTLETTADSNVFEVTP